MKYLIYLVLFTAIFSSCKKDAFQSDFDSSKKVWLDFKKSSNNNYTYTVTRGSWTGSGDSTIISVVNGAVTGRKYVSYTIDGQTGKKITKDSWTETKSDLNNHPTGAQTISLDAVYEKAAKEWLKADKKQNTIYFETKNQGMVSSCGYVPNGCQDDCFNGIKISNITKSQGPVI